MTEQHAAVPSDLTSLIERVEKATGPDRELDADIDVATFRTVMTDDDLIYARKRDPGEDATHPGHYFIKSRSGAQAVIAPAYTASIDAVLTLLPEGRGWLVGSGRTRPDEPLGAARITSLDGNTIIAEAEAATPCLALLAAILRARQTENSHDES